MSEDIDAPHGRDESGEPLAPYGLKVDGTPRKSRRGAVAGMKGNSGKKAPRSTSKRSATDQQRREMIIQLSANFVEMPLVAVSSAPPIVKRIGQRQADALAIDSYLISQFAPAFADGLITYAEAHPSALSWLDMVEDKAPILPLVMVGIQFVKALATNHVNPDHGDAETIRHNAGVRAARAMDEMQAEADAMGVPAGA